MPTEEEIELAVQLAQYVLGLLTGTSAADTQAKIETGIAQAKSFLASKGEPQTGP